MGRPARSDFLTRLVPVAAAIPLLDPGAVDLVAAAQAETDRASAHALAIEIRTKERALDASAAAAAVPAAVLLAHALFRLGPADDIQFRPAAAVAAVCARS
jgi:hypothetical protein